MLVLEARRLPFANVSAERAERGAKVSGWSEASLSSMTNWDKCMLPAVLPLLREARSALAQSTSNKDQPGSAAGGSSGVDASTSVKDMEKDQSIVCTDNDDEVRVARKILKELSELEAAYHQMKDARQHLHYLEEDRQRIGAVIDDENGDHGEYSWWPTDDDFVPTSCANFMPGRAETMASLQARTGFTLEEESFFASLLQHQKLLGGEDLDDVLFGKGMDRKQIVGGQQTGTENSNEKKKAEDEVYPIAEGMDPGIDIAMSFDLSQGGESCGIGSAALFGGHGIHISESPSTA